MLAAGVGALERGAALPDGAAVLKAMETPALRPALDALGFACAPGFEFGFVCNAVRADVPFDAVAPDRWYLLPTD